MGKFQEAMLIIKTHEKHQKNSDIYFPSPRTNNKNCGIV